MYVLQYPDRTGCALQSYLSTATDVLDIPRQTTCKIDTCQLLRDLHVHVYVQRLYVLNLNEHSLLGLGFWALFLLLLG